jgi:two-component system, cell cycle sensor histidine kinase and response regulator CckA
MVISSRLCRIMNLVLLFLLVVSRPVLAASPPANKHVLIIHSYHSGLSWTDSVMSGIRETVVRSDYGIQLSAEYLDARRIVDPTGINRIQTFIMSKLKGTNPDLVIVSDNAALDFMLKYRDRLFPDVPLVFCGINDYHPSMISNHYGITGVVEDVSIIETVTLALQFHPKTEKIVVIGRTSVAADKYNRDSFVAALPGLPARIQVIFWDDLPASELKVKMKKLEDDTIIFLNGLIQDDAGRQLMYGETTKWISAYSSVPLYSLWDVYLGYGIVGGKLVSGYRQGQLAAELALRIFHGESADRIPVINAREANSYMFDDQQLTRFNIPRSELPRGSVIINRPDSFYDKYRHLVWTTVGVVSILIGFVVILSITIMRRRKAEEGLRQANLVVENSPAVLFRWKAAEGWPVEFVSKNVIQFGYNPEEILSGKVPFTSMVYAEDLDRVATEVQKYSVSGMNQFRQEYRIVTRGGGIRWVSDHTAVERDAGGSPISYQGVVIDITDRKMAEEALSKRLVALIKPLDAADISFDDLFNIEEIQKIQDAFAEATNTGSLINRPDGTPITKPSNFRRLCDIIRKTQGGNANCCYSASIIGRHHPQGPIIQSCLSGGLWDAGASITVGGKHIASWIVGQVKNEEFDEEKIIRYAGEIGVDEREFREALREVPVVSKEQFTKIANALFLLANELSLKAYQNIQQARFIAERKRAEDALREKTEELDRIFNLSLDLLCIADTDGRFLRLNPAWEEMLGYPIEELEGRMFIDFVHPDDVAATERVAADFAAGRSVIDFTNRYRCRDGTYKWIEWRSKPYQNTLIYAAARDITQRKRSEAALRESERRLSEIIDFLPDATFAIDRDGKVIAWNRAIEEMLGVKSEDMMGKGNYEYSLPLYGIRRPMLIDLIFAPAKEIEATYHSIKREGAVLVAEAAVFLRGRRLNLWGKAVPLYDNRGNIIGAIEAIRDITELKQAEEERAKLTEQLFQSQKMETVGLLAGGMAHDFNNLLTPILGYSEIMMLNLPAEDGNRARLQQIKLSAERAKELIQRLLAFSRKQMLELKTVDPGNIIRELEQVLHRTIRENILIKTVLAPSLGLVHADKGQIEQVLLNLAINAQDAMPQGGTLTIESKNIDLDESYTSAHLEVAPGPYVMISVSDDGMGMDEETLNHIFEPFFTTKELGRGTGLGLASVYGIVKQHAGSISVYSEKNHGSVFKIFLPRVMEQEKKHEKHMLPSGEIEHGRETVLVVEDDEMVRTLAQKMLEDLGYQVLVAKDVDHCVEIAKQYSGGIHLLLTDVIMPKLNGRELYEQLKRDRPDLKVLFMSGYSQNVIGDRGVLDEDTNFLQKPFTVSDLSQKVRKIITS